MIQSDSRVNVGVVTYFSAVHFNLRPKQRDFRVCTVDRYRANVNGAIGAAAAW